MESTTFSRNKLLNQLLNIGHRDLDIYVKECVPVLKVESELFAHMIAWNQKKGEVRDSKIAFPVIALRGPEDAELYENAVAHLLLLAPKYLMKAVEFNRKLSKNGNSLGVGAGAGKLLKSGVEQYIRIREANKGWWTKTAVQHRSNLKALYALFHVKPNALAQAVLFDKTYPKGSVFEAVKNLKSMAPQEAAGTILNYKIPFLVAVGAPGGVKGKQDIILALMDQMSGNEILTNTNMLKDMGVFDNPVLKAAYDSALERGKKDKKVSTLKAAKAASKVKDAKVAQKLHQVQEEKLEDLGGIDGNWLVLGDRSGSMQESIEVSKEIAALIAQQVKGEVHLVFFNHEPVRYDVTGKTLNDIKKMTSRVFADGGTSIGCGLRLIGEAGIEINGIAICSDGGDRHNPRFHDAYKWYVEKTGLEPTVYHFYMRGDPDYLGNFCAQVQIPIQKYDMTQVDYYSLPNLVKMMRSNRYSLCDEILQTPLLTIAEALRKGE